MASITSISDEDAKLLRDRAITGDFRDNAVDPAAIWKAFQAEPGDDIFPEWHIWSSVPMRALKLPRLIGDPQEVEIICRAVMSANDLALWMDYYRHAIIEIGEESNNADH